jgi:hypothetical protein
MAQLSQQIDEHLAEQDLSGAHALPPKAVAFGSEYNSIADGDENSHNPIMWQVRLVKGKDRPKLPNGKWFVHLSDKVGEQGAHKDSHAPVQHDGASLLDR